MATKKKDEAAKPAAPAAGGIHGLSPDDPSYQARALASEEDLAVLDKGPEARRDAVLADIKRMHGG